MLDERTKFTILHEIWSKIRNFDEILHKIGDFGRTKNDILDICVPEHAGSIIQY